MSTNEKGNGHDVFISYRRDGGGLLARVLYETLTQKKYSVFFDYESLAAGRFDEKIVDSIRNATDVLVVLSKGSLERCKDPEDWVLREIKEALAAGCNIIPVWLDREFVMPDDEERSSYPEEILRMLQYNGYGVNIGLFDSTIGNITRAMKSKPLPIGPEDILPALDYLLNEGTALLSEKERKELVNRAFATKYGETLANIVASFVDSTTKQYNNIRRKFEYEIALERSFDFRKVDIDEEKYFELSERLSYKKEFLGDPIEGNFWISFARDLDNLDKYLKDERSLFGENLLMDSSDLQKLIALSDEDKMDFYRNNMRVHLNINGRRYQPERVEINEAGIFAYYEAKDMYENHAKDVLDFIIKFSIPHRKAASYFFVSINDPTYSPKIRFTYPEDEVDVQMIPFLNRAVTAEDTIVFEGERELSFEKEWVLPMSGAVFVVTLDSQRTE